MTTPALALETATPIGHFQSTFNRLNIDTLDLLEDIYTKDIVFTDPFHHIEGREALKTYFRGMYERLVHCEFEYQSAIAQGNDTCIAWIMRYQHEKIGAGRTITVHGCTVLTFRGNLVCSHRDYFDAGEMLYQQLPILGRVIRWIRARIAQT